MTALKLAVKNIKKYQIQSLSSMTKIMLNKNNQNPKQRWVESSAFNEKKAYYFLTSFSIENWFT